MRALLFLILCVLVWSASAVRAELVVVANPASGIERLGEEDVVNIFLGRYRRLASGIAAEPVDIEDDTALRARFYRSLVNKSLPEINAYWARLVFSGKTRPPRLVGSAEAALRFVASQPGGLAYLERAQADRRVKIVFELAE
ncbi:hypothetical protein [Sulfuricystis multivorans]|uniref:hypothetical protein n=1 Tax=Sulfuricystis multivorans TaxID=2211108 RepID=UPI000F83AC57|nr:hypothetical protein [Sulfuricystis multivorans]